jgi:hypothetical protein
MRRTKVLIPFLILTASLSSVVYAQRGETLSSDPTVFTNPGQGYPGFFDTNFADKGSLVVEWPPVIFPLLPMPSIAMDYGATDSLTVGTNAIVTTLPWLVGARGLSLKARQLIHSSETMRSAATVYGGYIGADEFSSTWQMFTYNHSWKLAPSHILSGQAMYLNFGVESGKSSSINYTNLRLTSLALGGGYQYVMNESATISNYLLLPGLTSIESDTVGANLSASLDASSGQMVWGIARSSFDIRQDQWTFSMGGIYMHGIVKQVLPWFSAATRW